MFDKRYYILETRKGQIQLVDGPFLFLSSASKLRVDNQWIELLSNKGLARLLD